MKYDTFIKVGSDENQVAPCLNGTSCLPSPLWREVSRFDFAKGNRVHFVTAIRYGNDGRWCRLHVFNAD